MNFPTSFATSRSLGPFGLTNRRDGRLGIVAVVVAAAVLLALLVAATLGAHKAEAAFPGTNGRIACSGPLQVPNPVSRLEIFTMDDSGNILDNGAPASEIRLTENFDSDFNPRYSADGRLITFIRQSNAFPGGSVWVMNADGSNERQLTFGAGGATGYSDGFVGGFSPDGTKIVFQRSVAPAGGAPRNFEVFTINVDGTGETNLTNNAGATLNSDSQPSWSADGNSIAFQSNRAGNADIWVMNANGSNPRNLTAGSTAEESAPEFSPDSQQIAFQSDRGFIPRPDAAGGSGRNLEIYRMSAVDGSNVVRLTFNDYNPAATGGLTANNLSGFDLNPHWSPQGDRIVFHSGRGIEFGAAQWDAFTINSATGENPNGGTPARRLTRRDGNDERCGWGVLTHRLTVQNVGHGTGTVTSSVPGINCPNTVCTNIFKANTQVTLTATPTGPSRFFGFSGGGCSGLSRTCTVTVDQAKTVTVNFAPPVYPLPRYPVPDQRVPVTPFADCPSGTANLVRGTAGNDNLTGTVAGDRIFAGPGNDTARGLAGNDCIDLGPGVDSTDGAAGNDLLVGGLGDDRILGGAGRDDITGNPDDDRLEGGADADRVFGDSGNDSVFGGSGNDRLHGVGGNDRVSGSSGRDRINGGAGRDRIGGGSSGDRIAGDQGNDRISGNSGADNIKGNSGADRINGGSGGDRLSGGIGNDRISARDGRRDRITCGKGRDSVTADRSDRVSRDCERVRRR
jgi:Tol biopolymer transport system component